MCDTRSSRRRFLARDAHYGIAGEWWLRECDSCASCFLEEPPSEEALASLYAPDYYAYSVQRPSRLRQALRRLLLAAHMPREPVFDRPGRVLDFGCGAGEYLLRLRQGGWDCAGVEISDVARARAAARGLDVRPALTGSNGFEPGAFDYVRANHSLEHVLRPRDTLRQMYEVLKPGGTLFIGVPTATSENARMFGAHWWHVTAPLHTFVPSTAGATLLVESVGFHITRVSTNSNFAGTAGSLQIVLNRGNARRSAKGLLFTLTPLLLVGHWYARLQDLRGVGDQLELIASKPVAETCR